MAWVYLTRPTTASPWWTSARPSLRTSNSGGATASNGKRIFAPLNADGVGVFDPSDNSFALVDISSTISTDFKFAGAATASNGKIIFSPYTADGVGVFDPTDNSFALVDISSTISTDVKFLGAATASNGKIIFTPYAADGVGVFDPTDNSFSLVDISSTISTDYKFLGAATASNGKIIFAPNDADAVGVFQAVHPPCDASTAPTNGGVGNCTSSLASGSSCQPTCDEGYSVTGTSSCIAGTLTAALCLTTCSRSSSLADVCCVDGTPHALESGVGHSAFCKISGISGSADCPPDWTYQPDHGGEGGQCIRSLSTRYGEGSGESTVIDSITAFNTCPTGNRETIGDMPLPCGSAEAVSSLCCVDPAFTLPSGASMHFFCKASKDGITAEECPNGWLHQGEYNQCMSFAPRVSSLSRCGASPPMSSTADTTSPPPPPPPPFPPPKLILDEDDHAAGLTGILVALVATTLNML